MALQNTYGKEVSLSRATISSLQSQRKGEGRFRGLAKMSCHCLLLPWLQVSRDPYSLGDAPCGGRSGGRERWGYAPGRETHCAYLFLTISLSCASLFDPHYFFLEVLFFLFLLFSSLIPLGCIQNAPSLLSGLLSHLSRLSLPSPSPKSP